MAKFILKILFSLLGVAILSVISFVFFALSSKNKCYVTYPKELKIEDGVKIEKLTGNALALPAFVEDFSFIDITKELKVYFSNPRPDSENKEPILLVELETQNNTKLICPSQKLYLAIENNHFAFSDTKSAIWITPYVIDEKQVKIDFEIDMSCMQDQKLENKKSSFIVSVSTLKEEIASEEIDNFKAFAKAKWLSSDLFLQKFKKEEIIASKLRLEIDGQIVFAAENDYLIFKEGKWTKAALEDTTLYDLAKIGKIVGQKMQIEAWQALGNKKYCFFINLQSGAPMHQRAEDLFTNLRLRTRKHISCNLENQRFVLKENEILIKRDGKWRIVKSEEEFLNKSSDEIFVFEKILEKNSKKFLKGSFFNGSRTECLEVEVPLTANGKPKDKRK
ncbi:MAG: hypothetical protein HZB76_04835 [Chlamydiae bacterium]|nr:hypothetical protein [Chlamydiota bacterium]